MKFKSLSGLALAILFSYVCVTASAADAPAAVKPACTLDVPIVGIIGPATLDLIERSSRRATELGCGSILLSVNTPGGNLQTTRMIVEHILDSEIPYLCVIAPSGGHAGSAGAIILQACHVSGGLSTTNIGAATPIDSSGADISKDLRNKVINDTVSWVVGLAKLRGRSESFARDIIEKAKAVSSEEALKLKALEWVGDKKEDFVTFANARKIKVRGNKEAVVASGTIIPVELDTRFRVMDFLTNPQIAYLLFMGSLGLLYFELTHPGVILPGIIGGLGLIISLMSFHMLDVTWAGLLLIAFGVSMMIAEAFVTSYGLLGLGGTVSFFLGSLFLFDSGIQGFELPLMLILPTTLIMGLLMGGVAYLAFSTRKLRKSNQFEDLVGHKGRVSNVNPDGKSGQMEINGEIWRFQSLEAIGISDRAIVIRHSGFTLDIERMND